VDAEIPEAEARRTDKRTRDTSISTFYLLCTRAFAGLSANNTEVKAPGRASEYRLCATSGTRQL